MRSLLRRRFREHLPDGRPRPRRRGRLARPERPSHERPHRRARPHGRQAGDRHRVVLLRPRFGAALHPWRRPALLHAEGTRRSDLHLRPHDVGHARSRRLRLLHVVRPAGSRQARAAVRKHELRPRERRRRTLRGAGRGPRFAAMRPGSLPRRRRAPAARSRAARGGGLRTRARGGSGESVAREVRGERGVRPLLLCAAVPRRGKRFPPRRRKGRLFGDGPRIFQGTRRLGRGRRGRAR